MQLIHTLHELRAQLAAYRHPAVVPTMGNLHEGHHLMGHERPMHEKMESESEKALEHEGKGKKLPMRSSAGTGLRREM